MSAIAGGLTLYCLDPSTPGTYPVCPSKLLTGSFDCPGCGTLRMLHNVLHFRILKAFLFNPLAFVFLPLMGYYLLDLGKKAMTGKGLKRMVLHPKLALSIPVGVVLYTIVRNIV